MSSRQLPKVCVIGAGPSGIATAKRLQDNGIPFDCFEASDDVGGTWYYRNPNGMSACYQSLHIDTSKWRLAFEDFPVPADWPDFPHHSQLHQYLRDYVDYFGLREKIEFSTKVEHVRRRPDGTWSVTLSTGEERSYDFVAVCNGHHWDPRLPDYPGEFAGELIHSHAYNDPFDPIDMRGKRVIVVGMGNSGLDIASELSQRFLASRLTVSTRRGIWVLPKYIGGVAGDKSVVPPWIPKKVSLKLMRRFIRKNIGSMTGYGLPEPDHQPFEAHPSASNEFLGRAGAGDMDFKPAIARLDGHTVHFVDGTSIEADVIVCATGYHISFPFFDDADLVPDAQNRLPLYKRMFVPGVENLAYMGLAQPMPTLVNFAEQQSKLLVAYLTGAYALPPVAAMRETIAADERTYLGRYYDSPRHTIQVEFDPYVRDLNKEIARGAKRAKSRGATSPLRAATATPVGAGR